ncbi:MAG: hypothetical protein J6R59_00495 [Paludibacteraceae bacterium]|nr:hypothetical protein [Paludibacteraceae bacterium]
MEEKKYIMWSDGVLTSFGVVKGKTECGRYSVANPASIAFAVVNEPVYEVDENGQVKIDEHGQPVIRTDEHGQPVMKGSLKWEMTPYVFGACLKDSADNIWTVNPNYIISDDAEYDERLIAHYETIIKLCDKHKG